MAGNGVLVETNGYDDDGHLVAHWTPAKGLTQYSFDDNGNLTSVAYSSGPNISAGYDSLNRITSMSDAVGASSFSYTNFGAFLGALATETAPWGSDTVTHNYANRLPAALTMSQPTGSWTESFAHADQLRLESVSSPAGTFTYDYSGAGQEVLNLTLPGGNNLAETYDTAGNILTTALERGSSVLDYSGYAYDQDANRTTTWRTHGAYVNYGYDDIGELTSAVGYETNGTLRGNENFGYGYDGAENLAFRTNNTLIQAFTSDNANELVNVTRNNNLLTVAGNLTNSLSGLSVNGQAGAIYADQTFAVTNGVALNNGLNTFTTVVVQGAISLTNTLTQNLPVSASLHYDLNGNLISDGQYGYSYDCANELTQVTATNQWQVQYVYDGFGRRRVRKAYEWVGGTWLESGEVRYIYDGMTVLQERNLQNSPVVTYTRGTDLSGSMQGAGGIGGLLARTDLSGNSYYHSDGNGNVTMLVDSGGNQLAKYLYDPYGNTLGMWGSLALGNTYRFSSKEIEANSGSYYYGYRYYQPNLQRWPNRGPLGEAYDFNLYRYSYNDSINYYDPDGRHPVAIAGAVGLALAAVAQYSVDLQKVIQFSDADKARAAAANDQAMQGLQNIINSDGDNTFQDEGLGLGGTMGANLPCNSKNQKLRNLFESLRNVEGYLSAANELATKIANNASGSQVPSQDGLQTPDQRVQLAKAFLARDQAYGNWLKRLY